MPRDAIALSAADTPDLAFHPLADIFPLLDGAEFGDLVADIRACGLREPIVLHPDGRGIDGRNRLNACRAAGVAPRFETYTGEDTDEAIVAFIASKNLIRRHLGISQRAMIAAKIATMRQGARTDIAQTCAMSQADAAAALRVSRRSVQFATQVRTRGAPALIIAVEGGKLAVSTGAEIAELPPVEQAKVVKRGEAAIIAAARVIKQRRKAARRSERQAIYAAAAAAVPNVSERYELHHAPCIDALDRLAPESVDLIVTDPPYIQESMPVYSDLAKVAAHVLRPGGLCFVMTGHAHLPEAIERLGAHLSYFWTVAFITPGSSAMVAGRNVGIGWKPVLVYAAPGGEPDRFFLDTARSSSPDKRFHQWGQSESGFMDLMRHFVRPGDTILDPFVGGGTAMVVGLKIGARVIGFDTSIKAIEATKARLAAEERERGSIDPVEGCSAG